MLVGRDEKGGKQVETEISRAGGEATFLRADVSRPKEVEAMVRTALEKYGRLDVMFNSMNKLNAMLICSQKNGPIL